MPVFEYDLPRFSAVVKHEYEPTLGLCREAVTLEASQEITLPIGTVLGLSDESGEYKISVPTATDGSEVPVGVLIADGLGLSRAIKVEPGSVASTKALILARGPAIVAGDALIRGPGLTLEATTAALKALGITVETAV